MRTLKKVLALSLVFAMAFTLMAGAAYKDEDSIDSSLRDDITLLEALGVFQGDENGNFNPTNNVTRAEAAKMIYVLKNNGVDDKAVAFQGVSTYSDVPVGHWAEGYVNYCTNLGIMSGWTENGQKVFNPSGNVTGVELTKMLLCLVGYKADVQGYTNNNAWQTNVLMDGANAGITNNYTPSVYAAAPRQWTARLLVNAINAPFVTYNRGEIMYGTADDPTLSYGRNYLRLSIAEGTLTATNTVRISDDFANTLRGTNQDDVIVNVEEINNHKADSNDPFVTTTYEDIDADNALLGQKVKVYYRTANFTDTKPTEVFAVLADSSEKVVNTTVDQISFSTTYPDRMTVEGEGSMNYTTHTIDLYVDNALVVENGTPNMADQKEGKDVPTLKDYLAKDSNTSVKLIYDDNNYVVAAYVSSSPIYAVVDDIDAENGVLRLSNAANTRVTLKDADGDDISFNRSNSDNFADYLNVDSSVAADDVVKITKNVSTGELKYDLTVLEPINASASSFTTTQIDTNDDGNKDTTVYDTITVDGTAYELNDYAMAGYNWYTSNTAAQHDAFYVDGSYVVYSTGDSSANINDLAFVYDGGISQDSFNSYTYRVKVLLADGTRGTYVLNKNDGIGETNVDGKTNIADVRSALGLTVDENNKVVGGVVYTYSLRDNTITLDAIQPEGGLTDNSATYLNTGANGSISYDESDDIAKVGNDAQSDSYVTNDSSYFFVVDNNEDTEADKYAVVKASELSSDISFNDNSAKNTTFVAQKINGFNTLLAGVMYLDKMPGAAVADYYFVNGTASASYVANEDGQYEITLPVVTADGESTLVFKYDSDSRLDSEAQKLSGYDGKLITVELEADGSADPTTVDNIKVWAANVDDEWHTGSLTAVYDNNARVAIGDQIIKVNADAKFFVIDNNGSNAANFVSMDDIVTADTYVDKEDNNTEKTYVNAVYLQNDDGEIVALFTETAGEALTEIIG